jgi:hypothetical protein
MTSRMLLCRRGRLSDRRANGELLGWVIADRDGWRAPDALPWDSPITEADFLRRARMSTTLRAPKAATGEPIREGAFDDR